MFRPEDVPDVTGKVFVITGGNSGVGFEAARSLAAKGGRVVLACRDAGKMAAAADQLRAETPGATIDALVLDLASLASIAAAAAALADLVPHVDVLINNAGVMAIPERLTADGFEMQFGTNHLGHFAFTAHVLPLVLAAPRSRVVTVSSMLHRRGQIDFDAIPKPAKYDPNRQYAMSKLANVLFTNELNRRLQDTHAIAVSCQPGFAATNLQNVGPQMTGSALRAAVSSLVTRLFAQPAAMGALGTLYGAVGDVQGGDYLSPTGMFEARGYPEKVVSSAASHDLDVAARLWDVSEALTGAAYAFPGGSATPTFASPTT